MKKNNPSLILFLISILLIFSSCDKEEEPENFDTGGLLKNGSVEYWLNKTESWYGYDGDYNASWVMNEHYDGQYSLCISSDIDTSEDLAAWTQLVKSNISVNKKLKLEAYLKLDNVTGTGIGCSVRADNSSNESVFFESTFTNTSITGSHDWKLYSLTSDTEIPEDAVKLYVFLIMAPKTTGTVYFDKISLTEIAD